MGFKMPLDGAARHLRAVPEPPARDHFQAALDAVSDYIENTHRAAAARRKREGAIKRGIEEGIEGAERTGDDAAAACFRLALEIYEDGLNSRV